MLNSIASMRRIRHVTRYNSCCRAATVFYCHSFLHPHRSLYVMEWSRSKVVHLELCNSAKLDNIFVFFVGFKGMDNTFYLMYHIYDPKIPPFNFRIYFPTDFSCFIIFLRKLNSAILNGKLKFVFQH